MSRNLVMSFLNGEGKKTNLTLNNVKAEINIDEINKAMDEIIAKNVFTSKGGDLLVKDSARLVHRTIEEFQLK
ncbi:DUF2922 domain-containing protein [Clostridium rectalis]|uniref:DUF2922 domain-containing protein n=1 Tax=Clostridium rectalis TaxID=2040295 RepID=UPI000F643BFA|nr:DUF2922 domain-containing protein [Clostridium rectalis]